MPSNQISRNLLSFALDLGGNQFQLKGHPQEDFYALPEQKEKRYTVNPIYNFEGKIQIVLPAMMFRNGLQYHALEF